MIIEKCQKVRQGEPCVEGSQILDVVREKKACEWCNRDWKMPIMEENVAGEGSRDFEAL